MHITYSKIFKIQTVTIRLKAVFRECRALVIDHTFKYPLETLCSLYRMVDCSIMWRHCSLGFSGKISAR